MVLAPTSPIPTAPSCDNQHISVLVHHHLGRTTEDDDYYYHTAVSLLRTAPLLPRLEEEDDSNYNNNVTSSTPPPPKLLAYRPGRSDHGRSTYYSKDNNKGHFLFRPRWLLLCAEEGHQHHAGRDRCASSRTFRRRPVVRPRWSSSTAAASCSDCSISSCSSMDDDDDDDDCLDP